MAFGLTCLYIFLSFVRILEMYPELAEYRPMMVLGLVALIAGFVEWGMSRDKKRSSLREVQIWLTVIFFLLAAFGWARIGWWDEMINAFNNLNVASPNSVFGSNTFGVSTGLQGGPFSQGSAANRKIELQATFSF